MGFLDTVKSKVGQAKEKYRTYRSGEEFKRENREFQIERKVSKFRKTTRSKKKVAAYEADLRKTGTQRAIDKIGTGIDKFNKGADQFEKMTAQLGDLGGGGSSGGKRRSRSSGNSGGGGFGFDVGDLGFSSLGSGYFGGGSRRAPARRRSSSKKRHQKKKHRRAPRQAPSIFDVDTGGMF